MRSLLIIAMLSLVPLFAAEIWRRRRVAIFDRLLFSTRVAFVFAGFWGAYHLGRLLSLWSSVNPGS